MKKPNKVTGAKAGGPHQLAIRTRWAARFAQFCRWLANEEGEREGMKPAILIRGEADADVNAITEVTVAAFKTLAISNHTEQFIIEALRAAHPLKVSLVAEVDGRVVGHIAFSPVTITDGSPNWYGLGPVSVLPDYQRRGIGSALIREGLSRLKGFGARGCCLVGLPEYYRRFGFQNIRGLAHEGVPEEVFFALAFDGRLPQGIVEFHEGFKANGQQGATLNRRPPGQLPTSPAIQTPDSPRASSSGGWG